MSLKAPDHVLEVDLARALEILAAPRPGRGRSSANVLKELGEHPEGGPVQVLNGRYGPYVKHGKINATLPKEAAPADVTLEQALALLAEKAAKPAKKKSTRKRKAKPKE